MKHYQETTTQVMNLLN